MGIKWVFSARMNDLGSGLRSKPVVPDKLQNGLDDLADLLIFHTRKQGKRKTALVESFRCREPGADISEKLIMDRVMVDGDKMEAGNDPFCG